jgi:sporulation protein YlmC with PRC-barrel domain
MDKEPQRPARVDVKQSKDNAMTRNIMILAGALALAAAPLAGQVLAQTKATPGATVRFVTEQPANEWLARIFIGQAVHNTTGETVGDVNDLVFDRQGRISTVVIGVGGFLGMGEKNVGVPFGALSFNVGKAGERIINVALTKHGLTQAPEFKATERTTFERVKDRAAQKIEDMRKSEPTKQ